MNVGVADLSKKCYLRKTTQIKKGKKIIYVFHYAHLNLLLYFKLHTIDLSLSFSYKYYENFKARN
jgi:hypothetical protein